MTTKSKTAKAKVSSTAAVPAKKKATTSKNTTLLANGIVDAVKFGSLRESSTLYTQKSIDILIGEITSSIDDITSKIKIATSDIDEIADMSDDVTLYETKAVVNKLVRAIQKLYRSFSE